MNKRGQQWTDNARARRQRIVAEGGKGLTIYFDADEAQQVVAGAKEDKVSMSAYVRRLVRDERRRAQARSHASGRR